MPIRRLTTRNVLTLKAAPGRAAYADSGKPGLYLRVSTTGDRTYSVRYRPRRLDPQGNPRPAEQRTVRRVTLGDARHMDLAVAHDETDAILGRVAKGWDPAAEMTEQRRAEKAGYDSLATLAGRLIKDADIAESTRDLWTWVLGKYIDPKIGSRRPGSITRGDVRDLLAGIKSKAVAKNTRRLIAWVFARAVEQDIVGASPCVGLGRPPKESPRDRVLTHAELRGLWNAAGARGAYGAGVRWLMLTAARKEEAFAATWGEIDREAKTWTIAAARAKNRQRHVVPLSQSALDLLDGLPEGGTNSRLFGVTATSKAWRQLLERAGIVTVPEPEGENTEEKPVARRAWTAFPIRLHDLRRTVRNALTHDLGVSVAVAEAVIGHKPPKLIETYSPAGVALRDVWAALDRWAVELETIVNGGPDRRLTPAAIGVH